MWIWEKKLTYMNVREKVVKMCKIVKSISKCTWITTDESISENSLKGDSQFLIAHFCPCGIRNCVALFVL